MRIKPWIQLALFVLLPGWLLGNWRAPTPPRFLSFLKRSDIAGIGKVLDIGDDSLRMQVDQYWIGDPGTNVIEI
ncbi:MAG: hypothetical protein ACOX9C_10195, partial [Kiritimatiellia bacterium]